MYRDIFQMDSYFSHIFKTNNMGFKMFKKLGLFLTMTHSCSWPYQSNSRGRWALKRFLMEFDDHLGKKLLFSELLDVRLYELAIQDPQKNDC